VIVPLAAFAVIVNVTDNGAEPDDGLALRVHVGGMYEEPAFTVAVLAAVAPLLSVTSRRAM
jgi:hypothetical protein